MKSHRASQCCSAVAVLFLISLFAACGGSGGGGGNNPPSAPTGVTATAGDQQVVPSWNASAGATSYIVSRSTTTGGPYNKVTSTAATTYTDSGLTNSTPYYYVVSASNANGTSANSVEMSATPKAGNTPPTPTGLMAAASSGQVALNWTASAGATSYKVGRATATGGPYTNIASPATNSYTDTGVTNGTTYFYVVAAFNANGTSSNSSEVSASPSGTSTAVNVTVDVMSNRHPIQPYVYGGAFPKNTAAVTDSGTTVVRWGGNAASTYNWKLFTYNADSDYFFEDFPFCGLGSGNSCPDGDSIQFINDVKAAGSIPLMTLPMLRWVAQSPEVASPPNNHWSFSVTKYGAQCSTDQFNADAGNRRNL